MSYGISDDYAVLITDDCKCSFYHGYEVTFCAECGEFIEHPHSECDCGSDDDREWCFRASVHGKKSFIAASKLGLAGSEQFEVTTGLLAGMARVLGGMIQTTETETEQA